MANNNLLKISVLLLLFVADRLIKTLLILKLPAEGVLIFPEIDLKTVINPNLALSLPLPNWLAIVLSAIVLILAVKLLYPYLIKNNLSQWGLGLLIIGSLSNLLDRFKYGGVIDWLNIWLLPSFNFSDLYILIACLLLFISFQKISARGGINHSPL